MIDIETIRKQLSKHVSFKVDNWHLTMWNEKDVRSTDSKNRIKELRNINIERIEDRLNNTHKSIEPIQEDFVNNVVLNAGLQKGIDLLINASSDRLDYNSLGTSSTAESVSQTNLQAEDSGGGYARRQFSVNGVRERVNQTMNLEMLWADTQVSAVPLAVKESGVHWSSTGTTNCYSRAVFTTFTVQTSFLFYIAVAETHQNGTL